MLTQWLSAKPMAIYTFPGSATQCTLGNAILDLPGQAHSVLALHVQVQHAGAISLGTLIICHKYLRICKMYSTMLDSKTVHAANPLLYSYVCWHWCCRLMAQTAASQFL